MKTKKSLQSLEKDGRIYSNITSPSKLLPDGYFQWRKDIEQLIEISKLRTAINVNTDTLTLYWNIGNSILLKQKEKGWGKKVIEQLSKDLTKRFPYDRGYSERNLRDMKRFAREYPDFPILQVPLAKLRENIIWQVSPAELLKDDAEIVQVSLAQITWYHHISLLSKVKNIRRCSICITKKYLT